MSGMLKCQCLPLIKELKYIYIYIYLLSLPGSEDTSRNCNFLDFPNTEPS